MKFNEDIHKSKKFKEDYLNDLLKTIAKREDELIHARDEYIRDIFKNQEKYREEFIEMLGWPLNEQRVGVPNVVFEEKLAEEDGISIIRMTFEILEGLRMTGLLFKKNDNKKRPFVIAQHGGLGTPERVAGIGFADTANYNYMIDRTLKYDVNVFAPQVILWSKETFELDFDRQIIDAGLKRVGGSITAVEVYGIMRILDYFEKFDWVGNFGMVGLSYGGFYTLFTTAVDTRIKSAISCSFFNDRKEYAWVDWTWKDAALTFSDAEIACLVYPRRLCVEVGDKDELFALESSKKEAERVKKLCGEIGTEWFDFIPFSGTHEFHKDDTPIERMVKDIT